MDFKVYIDGGLLDGGAGVVVTRGSTNSLEVVKTIRRRSASFTCSYEEVKRTLEVAANWLQAGVPQNSLMAGFTLYVLVPLFMCRFAFSLQA